MRSKTSTRSGFTLVELLVVMIIIAVLITITLVIGARVRTNGREKVTREVIGILDSALTELQAQSDGVPKPLVKIGTTNNIMPIADASPDGGNNIIDSCSWFVYQAEKVQQVNQILDKIPAKYITIVNDTDTPGRRSILDGFGQPIRYVHPAFHGAYTTVPKDVATVFGQAAAGMSYRHAQLTRDTTSTGVTSSGVTRGTDGGQCVGNRPYFYSGGADLDAKTREDNVYSESGKPSFVDG